MVDEKGCWLWTACLTKWGYGSIRNNKTTELAHRVSYRLFNGDVPEELCVLHTCDVPGCVNPDHLFLGTNNDNVQDKVNKNRQSKVGQAKGEKHSLSRLTEQDVLFIRESVLKQRELGEMFGVTQSQISHIKNRLSWNHI